MGGYSDFKLSEDSYQISFRGNGFTSREEVNHHLLTRAAELTKQNGYRYFIVLGFDQDVGVTERTTPTTISSSSNLSYKGMGTTYGRNYNYNGMATGYSDAVINPGQTYTVKRYNNSILIRMIPKSKSAQSALNADIILRNQR